MYIPNFSTAAWIQERNKKDNVIREITILPGCGIQFLLVANRPKTTITKKGAVLSKERPDARASMRFDLSHTRRVMKWTCTYWLKHVDHPQQRKWAQRILIKNVESTFSCKILKRFFLGPIACAALVSENWKCRRNCLRHNTGLCKIYDDFPYMNGWVMDKKWTKYQCSAALMWNIFDKNEKLHDDSMAPRAGSAKEDTGYCAAIPLMVWSLESQSKCI